MYYVVLDWREYHRLNPKARGCIFTSEDAALDAAKSGDEIIAVDNEAEARRVARAFHTMAGAAWAPNQSAAEREANEEAWQKAARVLERARARLCNRGW